MTSTLIRNAGAIVTGQRGAASRTAGPDIRIRGNFIDAIGALTPEPGERVVDATDCVVYPAWVNTHHHLFQSLIKGDAHGLDLPLTAWLAATPYRFRAAFDEGLFRTAVRIGLLELALSGCDSSAILFEEAERMCLRMVLCRGGATKVRQLEAELPQALRPESLDAFLGDVQRLTKLYHDASPNAMRRVVMAPTTPPYSMAAVELVECARTARSLGIRLHSHLSETVSYQDSVHSMHGVSPVRFVAEHEWLGNDVWFAHLVKLDAEEIALLGSTGTGIAHCPQSNGRLGSGIAPILALQAAGVPISMGVDGAASNEAADMISEVHAAWLMQRAAAGDRNQPVYRGGNGEGESTAVSADDVVAWGTSGGAKVLGLDAIGTLAPGMAADIALYALDDPRYFGLHDVAVGPVASGGRPALKGLWVNGQRVVEDDVLRGVDVGELRAQARGAVWRLMAS
jgi:8-oxoguanine deaminase